MDTESGLPPKLDLTGEEFMKSDGVNGDHSTSVPVTSQHKNKVSCDVSHLVFFDLWK